MGENPKISIIMPIYNVSEFVDVAIESVLVQSFTEFELIILNAGSTDNSMDNCLKYAQGDDRIKLIDLGEKIGPGIARNKGIDIAKGQYIMFMDGDDYIEADMLKTLYTEMIDKDAEVVVCGYFQDFMKDNKQVEYTVEVLPPEIVTHSVTETVKNIPLLDVMKVLSFSWNKLYDASIIKNNLVKFPDIMHSEDYFFVLEFMQYVNKLATVKHAYYHYIKRECMTLTNQAYHKDFLELMKNRFSTQVEILKKFGVYDYETKKNACSEHIKNIFLALENECAKQSNLTGKQRRANIRKLIAEPYTIEAIENSEDASKVIAILNKLIRTKNAYIIDLSAKLIYFMKNKMSKVYHKMKTK